MGRRAAYAPKKPREGCHPDEWNTPPDERRFVLRIRGNQLPDLDPCAKSGKQAFGRDYLTPRARRPSLVIRNADATHGGLAHRWRGFVFLNPPYSELAAWMRHAWIEATKLTNPATVLALVPVRTGRPWWQDYATAATARWDVPGRIRFWDPKLRRLGTSPTFDSAYLLFDPFARYVEPFVRACAQRCNGHDRVLRPNTPGNVRRNTRAA